MALSRTVDFDTIKSGLLAIGSSFLSVGFNYVRRQMLQSTTKSTGRLIILYRVRLSSNLKTNIKT